MFSHLEVYHSFWPLFNNYFILILTVFKFTPFMISPLWLPFPSFDKRLLIVSLSQKHHNCLTISYSSHTFLFVISWDPPPTMYMYTACLFPFFQRTFCLYITPHPTLCLSLHVQSCLFPPFIIHLFFFWLYF